MKNKNTPKIIGFAVNITMLLILLLSIFVYFYPEIIAKETEKKDLLELKDKYEQTKVNGLEYIDFKKKKGGASLYQTKILSKIDKEFYNKNFYNSGGEYNTYIEFLENLDSKNNGDLKVDYIKKKNKINQVLPVYVDNDEIIDGKLTDFKFINFVENLLYNYNLRTISSIGIDKITKVEEFSKGVNDTDLGTDIFMIDLPLTIEGKKKNIISFLDSIYKMGLIKKDNGKLIIDNLNNFVEITSIEMTDYIDSSTSVNILDKNKTLIEILKTSDQKNEAFELKLNLVFYVKGLANYQLKETIKNILEKLIVGKYKTVKEKEELKELEKTNFVALKARLANLKNKTKDELILKSLNVIDMYLIEVGKKVLKITKNTNLNKDLYKYYEEAQKYKKVFDVITKELDKIEEKLK